MTQTEEIKNHLESGFHITPLSALNLFGCFRLGARIFELKEQGMAIASKMIKTGSGKHVKQYWLEK